MTAPARTAAALLACALVAGGSVLGVGAAHAAGDDCAVSAATITWGFKESFRSYVSGTIANGEWTVADGATYETPDFGWSDGVGTISERAGSIDFSGSIEFTGHGGILDTTVANPTLVFDGGSTARLLLDVAGTTQQGAAIDEKAVEFAVIDLTHADYGDGIVSVVDAPTTLTEEGSAAFGTYEAGEPFDPITAQFSVDPDCLTEPVVGPSEPVLWAGAIALVATLGIALVAVMRRRPATED